MAHDSALRAQLVKLLDFEEAHDGFDPAVKGGPAGVGRGPAEGGATPGGARRGRGGLGRTAPGAGEGASISTAQLRGVVPGYAGNQGVRVGRVPP